MRFYCTARNMRWGKYLRCGLDSVQQLDLKNSFGIPDPLEGNLGRKLLCLMPDFLYDFDNFFAHNFASNEDRELKLSVLESSF